MELNQHNLYNFVWIIPWGFNFTSFISSFNSESAGEKPGKNLLKLGLFCLFFDSCHFAGDSFCLNQYRPMNGVSHYQENPNAPLYPQESVHLGHVTIQWRF